ncbi:MAG: DNA polymerase III subunit delta [Clostridiaceae bacterium]|jgi:DNA polymerase-3 subunit delta|nr:DNA polymerase III subunit delta [Clostridiaceae bacterium]
MAAKDPYAGNDKLLWKSIKENNIGRLYLFFGPEEYLIRNYCEQMEKRLLGDEFKLLNKAVLNGRVTPAQVIENCRTYPVFSDRKMVVVRDSGLFKSGKKSDDADEDTADAGKTAKGARSRGKDADGLAGFLQDLPEHICLVFIEKEINRKLKYVGLVEKHGLVVQFDYKKPDELAEWVIKRLREMQHDASPRTAAMIVEYCEPSMDDVLNELNKLCAYAGDRKMINEEDVAKVCTRSIKSRIFDLTDALAAKQSRSALSILNDMVVLKEPMPRITFMIARQFRQLIQTKLMVREGAGKNEIASFFKLPPFIAGKIIRQAAGFDMDSLRRAVETGLELDLAVKNGRLKDRAAVELLITSLSTK